MRIDATGLAETIERMNGRTDRVNDLGPALEFFGEDIVTRTDSHFRGGTNWDGSPFAPLADSTLEQRASKFAGGSGGIRSKRSALRTKLKTAGKSNREIARALKKNAQSYQYKRVTYAAGLTAGEKSIERQRAREAFDARNDKIRAAGKARSDTAKSLRNSRAKYKQQKKRISSPAGIKILIDTARARNSNHVDPPQRITMLWSAVGYLGYHMSGTRRMPERNPTPFMWNGSQWALAADARKDLGTAVTNYVYRGEADRGAA